MGESRVKRYLQSIRGQLQRYHLAEMENFDLGVYSSEGVRFSHFILVFERNNGQQESLLKRIVDRVNIDSSSHGLNSRLRVSYVNLEGRKSRMKIYVDPSELGDFRERERQSEMLLQKVPRIIRDFWMKRD